MITLKNNVAEIDILKRKGWVLSRIEHVFENDRCIEIKVVFSDKNTKDRLITINTKSKTFMPSTSMPFDEMELFSKIALEGGFDVNE